MFTIIIFRMKMANNNPWNVPNAAMFLKYCCPECDYQITQLDIFEAHATSNHALSKILFENGELKNEFQIKQEYDDPLEYENDYDNGDQQYFPEELLEQSLNDDDKTNLKQEINVQKLEEQNKISKKSNNKTKKPSNTGKSSESKTFPCTMCSKVFDRRKDFNLHLSNDHESKCAFCAKQFDKITDLWSHENNDHKDIPCDECSKIFKNPTLLRKHKKSHDLKTCEFCGKMIMNVKMKQHIDVMHSGIDKSVSPFKCNICSFATTQKRYLSEHNRIRHGPDKIGQIGPTTYDGYCCHICKESFLPSKFAERSYVQHYRSAHHSIPPEFEDKEKFICEQCPEIFFKDTKLKHHIKSIHGTKNQFTCEKCKESFFGRRNYAQHCQEVHNEVVSKFKSIQCNSCVMKFTAPNSYIKHHQRIHGSSPPEYENQKLFVCDQCTYISISEKSLFFHIVNVHRTGDDVKWKREKKCPHCEKVFKSGQNLKEHILTKHENKKNQHCDECNQSFGTVKALSTHKLNVHNRVRCEECGKESYNSFALKRHKALVHGIKPKNVFQCEYCPLFFNGQSSLEKHLISKHH